LLPPGEYIEEEEYSRYIDGTIEKRETTPYKSRDKVIRKKELKKLRTEYEELQSML
jgi:hypothetical protein